MVQEPIRVAVVVVVEGAKSRAGHPGRAVAVAAESLGRVTTGAVLLTAESRISVVPQEIRSVVSPCSGSLMAVFAKGSRMAGGAIHSLCPGRGGVIECEELCMQGRCLVGKLHPSRISRMALGE